MLDTPYIRYHVFHMQYIPYIRYVISVVEWPDSFFVCCDSSSIVCFTCYPVGVLGNVWWTNVKLLILLVATGLLAVAVVVVIGVLVAAAVEVGMELVGVVGVVHLTLDMTRKTTHPLHPHPPPTPINHNHHRYPLHHHHTLFSIPLIIFLYSQ